MKVTITPGKAKGVICAPPSKSMAHRLLMGAGLADGISTVRNIDLSEDIKATLGILNALGATYTMDEGTVTIQGIGGGRKQAGAPLDCKESGSTLRFFVPLVLLSEGTYEFTGAKRLFERPLSIYEDICNEQGIVFEKRENGLRVSGKLQATHYRVPGNISSQFITGLLYALPLLETGSVLEVLPPVESSAYIEMTLEALGQFGIQIQREGNSYVIPGGQMYHPQEVTVEGDYSNAAFLEALSFLGGDVLVEGLRKDTLQGDSVYQAYYNELKQQSPQMDLSGCPDLGPILMGLAAAQNGAHFTGTGRLRIKESDRGAVMAEELAKFGIRVDVMDNEIVVHKGMLAKPREPLSSHNDHRIAMTMATLCTLTGGTIDGAEAVRKSYPKFYEVLRKLGIEVTSEK